jgi:CRISPR type III-A-associated protein Csm2
MSVLTQLRSELGTKSMSELSAAKYAEENGLADQFARDIQSELKPTQLRRFFHQIKSLHRQFEKESEFDRTKVALVMPALAYAVGRSLIPVDFYELMKFCFGAERCKTKADFENSVQFLEAILAYHKYYEKINSNRRRES